MLREAEKKFLFSKPATKKVNKGLANRNFFEALNKFPQKMWPLGGGG